MNEAEKLLKSAEERHVWQYAHEVAGDERNLTVTVAEGTQIAAADGRSVVPAGKTLSLPAGQARSYIAQGFAKEAGAKR